MIGCIKVENKLTRTSIFLISNSYRIVIKRISLDKAMHEEQNYSLLKI